MKTLCEVFREAANAYKKFEKMSKSLKKLFGCLLLVSMMSCYRPTTVKTVVVAEKLTRNGTYKVICSDGYNTYKISPFTRIPLGQRVDMDTKTHSFKIVGDLNGRVNIGMSK